MKFVFKSEVISSSKIRITLICYMVVASYLHTYGCAISLPKNAQVPAFLVFGDSVVDTGNNNYLATLWRADVPPYGRDFEGGVPTGRFSNGKVPSDLIAEAIGVKELVPPYLDPTLQISDLLTGVSFASGGSGYDPYSAKLANVLTLEDQLKLFRRYINKLRTTVGENRTQTIITQSVYLVCTGSNDIMNTYFGLPFRRLHYDVSSYTGLMVKWASTFMQELHNLGARKIGVCGLPPCGCVPSKRTLAGSLLRRCAEEENQAAMVFNNRLYSELSSINRKLSGSRIIYLDIYNPLVKLVANPSNYGFQVVARGCCGTGIIEASVLCTLLDLATCKDDSKYIFWDSVHPTEAAYRILVRDVIQKSINEFF